MTAAKFSFVVAVNDRDILNRNLLASSCVRDNAHQLIIQEGYASAAQAYNEALLRCENEIVIFVHQDVFFPPDWETDMASALDWLQFNNPRWGVVGCWGISHNDEKYGHLYTPGEGVIGRPMRMPQRVRVLDEVVLAIRKSSGLCFGEDIPGFHFYGGDICLTAEQREMDCYAISAFCVHNSRQYFDYPKDFYVSYRQMKRKWRSVLPIQTSCIRISKLDRDIWKRRAKAIIARATGATVDRGPRMEDPHLLIQQRVPKDLQAH